MADVNNTDVRTATNASNTTRYFHLPLFIASDKPSWLVDWNGAMGDIDNILQEIATASEGAVADVATIQSQIDALNATIPNLEALVNTAVSDVAAMQTTVDSHETRMDNIEQDLITQNNLIKTLSDAVTTMQGTVATLNNRVAAMETTVSGYDTEINAIQTGLDSVQASLTSLQSTVSGHTSSINSLDTRVTALETAGSGGGLPVFSDLTFTIGGNITSKSATESAVAYTATEDCYVYAFIGFEHVPEANTNKKIQASVGLHVNASYVGDMASIEANQNYGSIGSVGSLERVGAVATSGLYKLKAGDQVLYNLSSGLNASESNDWFNCNIFVAAIN